MATCAAAARVGEEVAGSLGLCLGYLFSWGTPADPGFSPSQHQGQEVMEETSGPFL